MAKAICITGTPGTGKTTLAHYLSKEFSLPVIDVHKFAKENKAVVGFDKERNSDIIDEEILVKSLESFLASEPENAIFILEGHLSHLISPKFVLLCIVTNCELSLLRLRLVKRGYSEQKIRENLEAHIFKEIEFEARSLNHDVFIEDTSKKPSDGLKVRIKAIQKVSFY